MRDNKDGRGCSEEEVVAKGKGHARKIGEETSGRVRQPQTDPLSFVKSCRLSPIFSSVNHSIGTLMNKFNWKQWLYQITQFSYLVQITFR